MDFEFCKVIQVKQRVQTVVVLEMLKGPGDIGSPTREEIIVDSYERPLPEPPVAQ